MWLRAEEIRHLVLLRAHLLGPGLLPALVDLAAAAGVTVWGVWHHHGPPPTTHPCVPWTIAVAALRADGQPVVRPGGVRGHVRRSAHRGTSLAARRAAARLAHPPWQHTQPGCEAAAVLQRLTIDAANPNRTANPAAGGSSRLHRRGPAPVPAGGDPAALSGLGPRLGPVTVHRLVQLVCPTTAAAVMLGLATGAEARFLARHRHRGSDTDRIELAVAADPPRVERRENDSPSAPRKLHRPAGSAPQACASRDVAAVSDSAAGRPWLGRVPGGRTAVERTR